MIVKFKSEGGFAYFPGLNKEYMFDSRDLNPEDLRILEGRLKQISFFNLPSHLGRIYPDAKTFIISVESGTQKHTVSFHEPISDKAILEFIDFVREKAI